MRAIVLAAGLGAVLALGGCASTGAPNPTYGEELAQLSADCEARGGIITPIAGAQTGRANSEYACEIRGGATPRLRGDR